MFTEAEVDEFRNDLGFLIDASSTHDHPGVRAAVMRMVEVMRMIADDKNLYVELRKQADDSSQCGRPSKHVPTDYDLCGKARCGCVHSAETGMPCQHDLILANDCGVITDDDLYARMKRLGWVR